MSLCADFSRFYIARAFAPISVTMQRYCFGFGVLDLSKLAHASCNKRGQGMVCTSTILDSRQQKFIEIAGGTGYSRQGCTLSALALAKSDSVVLQAEKLVPTYRFHTETGDQVKVLVEKELNGFRVRVELLSSNFCGQESAPLMFWGLFRSDSSSFMPLDFQGSGSDVELGAVETAFTQVSLGMLVVELDFESRLAPFYISFVLRPQSSANAKSEPSEIRSHRKTSFVVPVGFGSGRPAPLGLSFSEDGTMNFAVLSRDAEHVVICFYDDSTTAKPALEIDLDPYVNRSGHIWHASMESGLPFVHYGYRCKVGENQDVLLDPRAKVIGNVLLAGSQSSSQQRCLSLLCQEPPFDWERDIRPSLPMEELIVYRLNMMRFTIDKSSKLSNHIAGTFIGITEKLQHIKELGVNAILFEPIFPFDEQKGPYFPLHFFSPGMPSGSSGDSQSISKSLKEMVKVFHSNGIEVFLEVVFTHTAESAALQKLDRSSYYHVKAGHVLSWNLLNCNYPIVIQMILDSLRHWVIEFHVDGFCFVNASALLKGFHGELLSRPPLVEAIAFDPILSKVKIIADSWDPLIMETKEIMFPHWKRWAEINSKFCVDVRNFLRGKGLLSSFATRLCGSADIFLHGRAPAFSFKYVARNFGLSLVDLVSYSSSTELASECSWNCGEDGPTNKSYILEIRNRQIRNFLFILFMSQGVPVLNMGDECGQSSGGSPDYGDRKPFDWDAMRTHFGIQTVQFISFLSSLRFRRRDLLQRKSFLREENIMWYGKDLASPLWDDLNSKFLAMTLKTMADDEAVSDSFRLFGDLFLAFNAAEHSERIMVPAAPTGMVWYRLVDTGLSYPGFFSSDGVLFDGGLFSYDMQSHSCALFEARSPPS